MKSITNLLFLLLPCVFFMGAYRYVILHGRVRMRSRHSTISWSPVFSIIFTHTVGSAISSQSFSASSTLHNIRISFLICHLLAYNNLEIDTTWHNLVTHWVWITTLSNMVKGISQTCVNYCDNYKVLVLWSKAHPCPVIFIWRFSHKVIFFSLFMRISVLFLRWMLSVSVSQLCCTKAVLILIFANSKVIAGLLIYFCLSTQNQYTVICMHVD